MIKELPIIDNPWIQTYQIRNFELGILQNQVPWIYGKYINCCCHKKSFTHCIGSHGRFFTKDNAMLMQKFKFDKSIFENSNWNFVEFVKNMIDHQWYVLGDFDEYCHMNPLIVNNPLYQHIYHSSLIENYIAD